MEEKKLMVAILKNGLSEEERRLYCIPETVMVGDTIAYYKATQKLVDRIALNSKDGKIYDMGWIEDDPAPVKDLLVDPSRPYAEYQFMADWFDEGSRSLYEKFGFDMDKEEEKYKNPWTVELQLEELN